MKKRFALMRALLHNPELLLLDEPTKSLDYTGGLNLRSFIKETLVKEKGKAVIFTTHQMEEALDFADLVMILHKGRLFAFGTLAQLRKKINNPNATLGQIFLKLTDQH
jgi:ABC-2 type transport system ATP-binding protein